MEKHLGRKLTSQEEIHHINGNSLDNRLENLLLTDKHHHLIIEHKLGTYKNAYEAMRRSHGRNINN